MRVTAAVIVATTRVYDMPGLLALAPWTDDETLIEWQLAQVLAAGVRDVEVVIPPDGDTIIPLVARDNVEIVIDARNTGVASAIQAGVIALPRGTTGAVILDVAQPTSARIIERMIGYEEDQEFYEDYVQDPPGLVAREQQLASLRNLNNDEKLARWNEALETAIRSRETYDRYRDALT